MTDTKREAPASLEKRAAALEIVLTRRGWSTLCPSGSGYPPRSPRPRDVRRPPEEPAPTADDLVALLARADEVTQEAVNTIPAPASPASRRAATPRPG